MLPLDDTRWQSYLGGYRVPYDASVGLTSFLDGKPPDPIWEEFWDELHHQGDVHQASYAAVPWLIEFIRRIPKLDWNPVDLVATIELQRDQLRNPKVAPELADSYFLAIRALPEILSTHPDRDWGEDVVGPAVACIALARGQRWFARACIELDRDTAGRWFTEEFGWKFPEG
ncbi:hypothetical protein P12x_003753 [Tundrisphaera lichenicola]|uniref:hypothetical protein n=1 Tax=Tundrisphaera lichenicola TaxID=2029860 RepID=UPI003EBA4562